MLKILFVLGGVLVLVGLVLLVLRRSFVAKPAALRQFTDAEYAHDYEVKKAALERLLGPLHELVGHAIIAFQVGGPVDMYYFPKGIPGTGFATMELLEPDGTGPRPNRIGTYELVAFTRHTLAPSAETENQDHPFNRIERRVCRIFTRLGWFSREAVLNPGETVEIPVKDGEPNLCLILDEYKKDGVGFVIDGKRRCLLLCVEVFRSEMEYAMRHGSAPVLAKLKEKGHYPYSDLDREPVF